MDRARQWGDKLLSGPITYFPVRHHSPACASRLATWIDQIRPDSIVIEGPKSLDRWIPSLTSEDCRGPVAVLATFSESNSPAAARHSAFYPLCDYSPEWVALQHGHAIGANVRFADLEFADKVIFQQQLLDEGESPKSMFGVLLADESNLRYSQFINKLVRRMGCRDFDELWDHFFESRSPGGALESFVGDLATYCDLSRQSHDAEHLQTDATLAREAVMVEVIRAEYKRLKKPQRRGALLVVTGGFHTVALPDAVQGKGNPHLIELQTTAEQRVGSWLIRYSYDQLDALSGYRSGMPSPGFYDAIWQAEQSGRAPRDAIAGLISTIARETRGQPIPHEASVTDSIAALQMMDRLAEIRSHAAPTRSDLLDAIFSCMRKDNAQAGDLLSTITDRILAGQRIGQIPASAGQPPIVADFQRQAADFRLPVDTIEPRGLNLELYRKPKHRPISFFLHQLQLLDVPFASYVDGPDFIHGHRLSKLREEWSVAWTPGTEARLAEQASLGESVAGAGLQRLMQIVEQLEAEGAARSADAVVNVLIRACRCGLHTYASKIVSVLELHIAEDPSFASVAQALSRLSLLRSAREPLEAHRLQPLNKVIAHCYRRAVHLIDLLGAVPDDQLDSSLEGFLSIREMLASLALAGGEFNEAASDDASDESDEARTSEPVALDANLFFEALARLIDEAGAPVRSEVAGAAAGVLYGASRIEAERVCHVVGRYLDSTAEDVNDSCGVIRGLMMTARESFWRMDPLLKRIDALFQSWEDERFNNALPHMRLAFSQLSPQEVDSVAERVAHLHDVEEIGVLVHPDISELDLQTAVQVAELMNRSLREDGLQ